MNKGFSFCPQSDYQKERTKIMKKESKNNILVWASALLLAVMLLAVIPTEAEAEIYNDTLRLHILANSNAEADQDLKLKIRDKVLIKYAGELKGGSYDDSIRKVSEMLPKIEADVNTWLLEFGSSYTSSVTLTEEWYDTREYDDYTLPSGRYMSLRIIIGEGEGKNWWCVMYPPLCMNIATENAPADDGLINYSKEEITLIKSKKYNIKFKLLETFTSIFAKNG